MPEATVVEQATEVTSSLGWRAGLPDDLKQNADIANYKTVGDFTKDALTWKGKVGELEGKLANSVPKLAEDATDEDKAAYFNALGRPAKASEYEFDGEDKNAPEWTNFWKDQFHGMGLTKSQAKALSEKFNVQIKNLVDAANASHKAEIAAAEQKLRTELGDKFDTNVELAKRVWQKHGEGDFDKMFSSETSTNRYGMVRFLLKMAALTGEDTSPQSGNGAATPTIDSTAAWKSMYANPKPGIASRK